MERKKVIVFCFLFVALTGCGSDNLTQQGVCDGYPDPQTSFYVLPYAVGETYEVGQGNCSPFSHYGPHEYAYDFIMDIGTPLHAVRSGVVIDLKENKKDGDRSAENYLYIKHADGTVAAYIHLTQYGALVEIGQTVTQGEVVALSGNTGNSTGPHLHFHVQKKEESDYFKQKTIPVTFRNADDNERGLQVNKKYTAMDFEPNDN